MLNKNGKSKNKSNNTSKVKIESLGGNCTNMFALGLRKTRDDVPEGMGESVVEKWSPFMEALRLTSALIF
jgi:hypothetical protein